MYYDGHHRNKENPYVKADIITSINTGAKHVIYHS